MVFEQLYDIRNLEERPVYCYLMGLAYAVIGIFSAKIIFGSSPGLMAVAFTSMLLMPTLNTLLRIKEERVTVKEKFSLRNLFTNHRDIFTIYFYLFMGVFTTFAFFGVALPKTFALSLFGPQLAVGGFAGNAFNIGAFQSILFNNIKVMIVCLLLSFFYGAGSILFLAWNASVWGVIFGYVARTAALTSGVNPFAQFGTIILPVIPHLVTEAASYFTAAFAGGVISKAVLREKLFSDRFAKVFSDAMIIAALGLVLVVVAAFIEVAMFS